MDNPLQSFRKLFANRPDSEHQQAIVRLMIAAMILAYLLGLQWVGSPGNTDTFSVTVILIEAIVGLLILLSIIAKPGITHWRRIIGMLADYTTLAVFLSAKGEVLSPLYVVLLWVTIGNGLRYGTRYLLASMGLSLIAFSSAIAFDPFWRSLPHLTVGLFVGLIAIPVYLIPLQKNLRSAMDIAVKANEAKSRFLATMSHEFRSPLNGIIGMADLLNREKLNGNQKESAEIILISAQNLLLLVDDVLDISAIEAGKLNRHDVDFSLKEFLGRIKLLVQPHISNKKLELVIQSADDVPDQLHGDLGHLTQIILNLMYNAVKFTEQGEVRLQVIRRAKGTGLIPVRFSIRDTGIGIPDADKKRIFEAFEQVESGPSRRYGGTGLGTTIAKTLTELLDGKIGLEENLGGGCHFWVDIELRESTIVRQFPGSNVENIVSLDDPFVRHKARVPSLRVLLADDQATNRTVLTRMLEKAGHQVLTATNGEEAIDAFAVGDIDLVVLDMHMPEMSGLEVLQHARVMLAGKKQVPFIVISADATNVSIHQALDAGAFAYLTKPVVTHRLLDTIAESQKNEIQNVSKLPNAVLPQYKQSVLSDLVVMNLGDGFLNNFVEECLRDVSSCLSDYQKASGNSDWDESREAAHAMKGIADNLGAESLSALCKKIMLSSNEMCKRDWRNHSTSLEGLVISTANYARNEIAKLSQLRAKLEKKSDD
jgi:two-component system, sensor histidine kinase RpfC